MSVSPANYNEYLKNYKVRLKSHFSKYNSFPKQNNLVLDEIIQGHFVNHIDSIHR